MTRKRAIKLLMSMPGVDKQLARELFCNIKTVRPPIENEEALIVTIGALLVHFPQLRPQAERIAARRIVRYTNAYRWRQWEDWFPSYYG